jgi:hypothetical protein
MGVAQVALFVEPDEYADTEGEIVLELKAGRGVEHGGQVDEIRVTAEFGVDRQV